MNMFIDKDDPKLTAYALGELPEDEIPQVEEAIRKNPQLQEEVDAIREMAGRLTEALKKEPLLKKGLSVPLTQKHQRRYSQSPGNVGRHPSGRGQWVRTVVKYCMITVVIGSGALYMLSGPLMSARTARISGLADHMNDINEPTAPAPMSVTPSDPMPPVYQQNMRSTSETLDAFPDRIVSRNVSDKNLEEIETGAITAISPKKPLVYPKDWNRPVTGTMANKGEKEFSPYAAEGLFRRTSERPYNTEAYDKIVENEFQRVAEHPLSTFSIDVDTASYSNVRRMLQNGQLPPAGAVRIEEMINYFDYDYRTPTDDKPFATHMQSVQCPWNEKHNLVRVGIKGKMVAQDERPQANIVFLLDVSGSMDNANKLPLVKEGMKLLVNNLNDKDRVAIVVYAGASGLVLPSTPCSDKNRILEALDNLKAGGSTNGGQGITLAYATAAANFLEKGINRVILCTDGDFNIGMTNQSDLVDLIEKKAKEKVFLTVLGFGMGNYKDSNLEKLADKGNGNYGYIDTISEAKKMLVEQLSGTLVTIAKDVKIQVEFNPQAVQSYRLIGYENRKLKKEDFNDDTKDAGEIGAGHTVTALYEVVPVGVKDAVTSPKVDALKYQKPLVAADENAEMLTLKLRYKEPDEDTSKLLTFPLQNSAVEWSKADNNTRFASSVAAFSMLLRHSKYSGNADYAKVINWANTAKDADQHGYREEFVKLVRIAASLSNR